MIHTKLIAFAALLLVADFAALIGMLVADSIWLAMIQNVVPAMTLVTTIVLAYWARKNTVELAQAKATLVETKAEVKETHGLVNSQSLREREQAEKLSLVLEELAELRGKTAGIQTGLAAGKVTADETTAAFEKGMGMVQTQAPAQAAVEPAPEKKENTS